MPRDANSPAKPEFHIYTGASSRQLDWVPHPHVIHEGKGDDLVSLSMTLGNEHYSIELCLQDGKPMLKWWDHNSDKYPHAIAMLDLRAETTMAELQKLGTK